MKVWTFTWASRSPRETVARCVLHVIRVASGLLISAVIFTLTSLNSRVPSRAATRAYPYREETSTAQLLLIRFHFVGSCRRGFKNHTHTFLSSRPLQPAQLSTWCTYCADEGEGYDRAQVVTGQAPAVRGQRPHRSWQQTWRTTDENKLCWSRQPNEKRCQEVMQSSINVWML